MYSVAIAYLLWFFSGFGALGLHRFYLDKKASGFVYLFTGGIFMLGGIYDFFKMTDLVREANLRLKYKQAFYLEREQMLTNKAYQEPKESIERIILKTARKNKGYVTPGEVAIEGDIPIEEAKKFLDALAAKGYAEMKIKKSGVIVYCFPEFMQDETEFEDI
jgi:TM2 domain-containing membrane protein YozV